MNARNRESQKLGLGKGVQTTQRDEVTARAKNLPTNVDRGAFDVSLISTLLASIYTSIEGQALCEL